MRWRCPRMAASKPPGRRWSVPSRSTGTTRMARMPFAHVCYETGEPTRPRLPVLLARHLSARRIFPWPSELAPRAFRAERRQLGRRRRNSTGSHRSRPAQRRAAAENVGRHGVPVALGARRPSARRGGVARDVRLCEQRAATARQRAGRSACHPGAGGDAR